MISRIDLRGRAVADAGVLDRDVLPRAELDVEAVLEKVRPICEDVRQRGFGAISDYSFRFDGVTLAQTTRVPREQLDEALQQLGPGVRAALEESIRRARLVHRDQRRTDSS